MQNKVIVIPEGTDMPYIDFVELGDFNEVQKVIGNYYEVVRPKGSKTKVFLVDEIGKLKHLKNNHIASCMYDDSIVGTVILCKEVMDEEGPELGSLTDEDIMWFQEYIDLLSGNFILDRTKEVD